MNEIGGMKRLFVVRHAKAILLSEGSDFDRPLHDRGQADVQWLGQATNLLRVSGDPILSSPSLRTKATALGLCKAWAEKPMLVQFIRNAYLASHHEWLEWIRECPDDASSCWIVGHNPGLSDMVKQLSGQELWLPTCGMAEIELDIESWEATFEDTGRLYNVMTPKSRLH